MAIKVRLGRLLKVKEHYLIPLREMSADWRKIVMGFFKRNPLVEMDEVQSTYGGRKPEYIIMLFAKKLDCLTKILIVLTSILAALTVVHIILLIIKT